MTLAELITLYRAMSFDNAVPPFCKDELLTIFANEAQDEACRRAKLLRDSTSAWCTIAVAPGDATIPLDPLVIQVLRAFADGRQMILTRSDVMDATAPGWEFQPARSGPTHLISGLDTDALHLWPIPDKACTIKLTVSRLPLRAMAANGDKPEIRKELHAALVDWMLYRVFSITDSELFDPFKGPASLKRFEDEFGGKASGRNEEWVRSGEGDLPTPIA